MRFRWLNTKLAIITLVLVTATSATFAQSSREAESEKLKRHVNQLEERYKQYQSKLKEINEWLSKDHGEEEKEQRKRLVGQREDLMAGLLQIKEEFAVIRKLNQEREREQEEKAKQKTEQMAAMNRLEKQYKELTAKLKAIDSFLAHNQGEKVASKRKQMMAEREDLLDAIAQIKAIFASANAKLKKEKASEKKHREEVHGERVKKEKVHSEVQTAINRLKHFEHALEHLREAGAGEIAQVVEERAAKMRQVIRLAEDRRQGRTTAG